MSPIDPSRRRPGEPILDYVRRVDPELVEAMGDVDRTLLRETSALPPFERLRAATRAARALARFRRAPT